MSLGGAPVRVLYVDDLADAVAMPTAGLERFGGLDVTVVDSKTAALEAIDDGFDCIVVALPGADGLELTEQLDDRTEVPVVVVGDAPAAERGGRALDAGAVEYVPREVATDSRELFARRVRRVATSLAEPGGGGPLADLPVPVLVGDETVVYANAAAADLFEDRECLTGAAVADLFEDCDSLAGLADADRETVTRHGDADRLAVKVARRPGSDLVTCVFGGEVRRNATPDEKYDKAGMLDSLMESIPLSIYFKDRQGRHVLVSDAHPGMNPASRILNHEGKVHHAPADIVGKTDFDLYDPEHAAETVADDERVMETGEPVYGKTEQTFTDDDEPMTLSTTKAPWYDEEGNVVGVVGVSMEVTDAALSEDAVAHQELVFELVQEALGTHVSAALDRIVDAALDGTSSDGAVADAGDPNYGDATGGVGDPNYGDAAMAGESSGTGSNGDEPAGVAVADVAADGVRAYAATLREHVDYVTTLATHGSLVTQPDLVDLETTARAAWNALDTGGATCQFDCDTVVRADERKVRLLFDHLLENAARHGGDGVTVQVTNLDDGFFVADDGPGIPSGVRGQVFRYGYSTTEDRPGRGLPLAKALASSMRWETSLTESAHGGCRIEVSGVEFK